LFSKKRLAQNLLLLLFAHINFAKCSLEGLAAGIGDILKTVFVVVVVPEWE